MKDYFKIYTCWNDVFKFLSDEQAGKLIKMLMSYRMGKEMCGTTDTMVLIAFEFIKTQIDADSKPGVRCEYER